MSPRIVGCAWPLVACGGAPPPQARGPEPIEVACEHVSPLVLAVAPDTLATADTPHTFEVPEPLLFEIMRSGKSRLWYTVDVCGGSTTTRGGVAHPTGFPELDQLLDAHLADLHLALPSTGCTSATFIVSGVDRACDARKVAD